MPNTIRRIAMWSGPRNISTALMRSWGSRSDTIVSDEPLYAHYLKSTQKREHPGFGEILATHETDWDRVVDALLAPLPTGKYVFYQKHMAHHLLPDKDLDWTRQLINCLLIREPREMLTSLLEVLPQPSLEETGLPMQLTLFRRLLDEEGAVPPILDSRDVLGDPQRILELLCQRLEVDFDPAMLTWEPGFRDTDGVWANHWYANVAESTTFAPYRAKNQGVPADQTQLLKSCEAIYQKLYDYRLH